MGAFWSGRRLIFLPQIFKVVYKVNQRFNMLLSSQYCTSPPATCVGRGFSGSVRACVLRRIASIRLASQCACSRDKRQELIWLATFLLVGIRALSLGQQAAMRALALWPGPQFDHEDFP